MNIPSNARHSLIQDSTAVNEPAGTPPEVAILGAILAWWRRDWGCTATEWSKHVT